MNCKPGDMAIVVSYEQDYDKVFVGLVLTTETLIENGPYPYWKVKEKLPKNGIGRSVEGILDAYLRPIRPDETPEESVEAMRLLTKIPKEEKV